MYVSDLPMSAVLRPSRLPDLDLRTPDSVAELAALVGQGYRACAGGSDLLLEAAQTGEPRRLAATARIEELARIAVHPDGVRVGASVTLAHLIGAGAVRAAIPAVTDGARVIGSVQLRSTATLAGNLCTASPAGDTIPGLFVHRARVETADASGSVRSVPVRDFATGPGETALAGDEVVTALSIESLEMGAGAAYRRFTERRAIDLAFASVAARVVLEPDGETVRDVGLALGAVGPTVIDADGAAEPLRGLTISDVRLQAVGEAAVWMCSPISDHRCSDAYRRHLVRVLIAETILEAASRARATFGEPEP